MYYDQLITLQKKGKPKVDEVGNEIPTYTEQQAWCGEISVTQSEFYSAASQQFKPEKVFELWDRDYSGEERCIIDGVVYEIYRSFRRSDSVKREIYLRLPGNVN